MTSFFVPILWQMITHLSLIELRDNTDRMITIK